MITILIPVFNKELLILKTISSLEKQTNKNFKVIFLDDKSIDNSKKNILENAKSLEYTLIENKKNMGVSYSRNKLMKECKTKYFSFLDADDELKPIYVQSFYNALNKQIPNVELKVIVSSFETRTDNGNSLTKIKKSNRFLYDYLAGKNVPNTNCWILHNEVISNNDIKFDEDLNWGEDMLFFAKVLTFFPHVHVIDAALSIYNFEPDNYQSLSQFRISQIADDIKWQNRLIDFLKSVTEHEVTINLLKEYRIPATIINRLYINRSIINREEIIHTLELYRDYLDKITLINGLRSIRLKLRMIALKERR